jgi:hypothetical protein
MISILGDFDGDGRADPVVADYGYNTNTGRVYIYYADKNRSPTIITGGGTNYYFGWSFQIGDFNGDGYDDIAIGSSGAYNNDGRVYVYLGSTNGIVAPSQSVANEPDKTPASVIIPPSGQASYLGRFSINKKININGDKNQGRNIGDIVFSFGTSFLVYFGRTTLPSQFNTNIRGTGNDNGYDVKFITPVTSSGKLKIGSAGDIDGDGFDDLILSHIGNTSADKGRVYIIFGDSSISGDKDPSSQNVLLIEGNSQAFAIYTYSNDYNSDGAYDVITRDSGYYLYEYKGKLSDKSSLVQGSIFTDSNYSWFGVYFSNAGDTNFDGYNDLVLSTNSRTLLVYPGSSAGISNNLLTKVSKDEGSFGINVSGSKKFNGDKFSDLLTVDQIGMKLYIIR